jgi:SSS family solute:Na+ symporter
MSQPHLPLALTTPGFTGLDWTVLLTYFGILVAITAWSIRQKQRSSADYFLASRHVGWFVIGASIFASNIGSEHLVGLAGAGAESGVAMAHYELHAWCILVLGWVFVPFYERSLVFTMPEFLEKRYSPASRWFLSVISLVAYVFTKVSVGLYAGGVVFNVLFPDDFFPGVINNFWLGALGVLAATGLYTVAGGMRAVVYTETLQTLVMILGSATILVIGLTKLGGWGRLYELSGSEYFNLWKPHSHPDFPWTGMLIGAPVVGLWYWCTDQYIVQRTLTARDERSARRGCIFASYLKILPVFLFIVPGMIAYAFHRSFAENGILQLPTDPATSQLLYNQAFPLLVKTVLPAGLRGLVVGGLLAALMSSLASAFNSSSTLFTVDIYKKLHPGASEQMLVRVGRVATTVMVLLSIAWVPLIDGISGTLYKYLQSVQAYIAPPIFAVFFLGIFFKRVNASGALAGLVGGFALGMARLAAELNRVSLAGTFLEGFATLNFLHFCVFLLVVSVAIVVGVSSLTPPPAEQKLSGLTYATVTAVDREKSRASWSAIDVFNTTVVLLIIAAIYVYFTG